MLDPLAVLPWLAAVTERISIGTSVIILPYRSPLPVAKLLASVDVLSGGRLIFGAGIGWMEQEFAALGVPIRERASRTDEALALIERVWTDEHPELETRRYRLHAVKASPLPLQKPRPPIWIGGGADGAFRRVARHGDGWHATGLSFRVAFLVDGVHRPAVDMTLLRGRYAIRGTTRQVVDTLRGYRDLGAAHAVLDVSLSTYPAILETIDLLAAEIRPALQA